MLTQSQLLRLQASLEASDYFWRRRAYPITTGHGLGSYSSEIYGKQQSVSINVDMTEDTSVQPAISETLLCWAVGQLTIEQVCTSTNRNSFCAVLNWHTAAAEIKMGIQFASEVNIWLNTLNIVAKSKAHWHSKFEACVKLKCGNSFIGFFRHIYNVNFHFDYRWCETRIFYLLFWLLIT